MSWWKGDTSGDAGEGTGGVGRSRWCPGGRHGGCCRVVVAYAWDEAAQTWRIYVPDLPEVPALNTLTVLEQGRTYWIAAAEPLTWAVATR